MVSLSTLDSNSSEYNLVVQKNFQQKKKILKFLFLNETMSSADLGKKLKLSIPKITNLLNELKKDGIVEEFGQGDSSGGRRPNLYRLKKNAFYIIGISINIYKTTICVFDAHNQCISKRIIPITISSGIGIIDIIVKTTISTLDESKINHSKVIGVGIEMPGMIDSKAGINKTHLHTDKPLAELFSQRFEMPVVIENDAKSRAFAELKFGKAKNLKNALVLHLDWGIGLGIIVNGKLYRGKNGFAGEFGHLPIVDNEILCQCGKQGCLETIASGTAIARMARDGIKAGKSSMLSNLVSEDLEKIETNTVVQAAKAGDQYTISILAEVGYWLGKGVAYLIQVFNPELIILGGRMAEANQFIANPVIQSINTFCNPELSNEVSVELSSLGDNAEIKGVAALLVEHVFDNAE